MIQKIIFQRRAFYEYTFHSLWRNKLTELNNTWIGFVSIENFEKDIIEENIYNLNDLNKYILKDVSQKLQIKVL